MIPLVRARYSANFIAVLRETGVSECRVMDYTGLTDEVLENPDGVTTIWQLGEVARLCAVRSGDLDLGWTAAASARLETYGKFAEQVLSGTSLTERLAAFCRAANDEYSEATFRLERRGKDLNFKRGPIPGDDIAARQTELYVVCLMLGTVRSVLGNAWHPKQICLQTFHRNETEALFDTGKTELRFDQPETVIKIENKDLATSLGESSVQSVATDIDSLSIDTGGALSELIDSYIGDPRLSLEFIARICGLHPRNLQRMLARQNRTFGETLSQRRISAAIERLRGSDLSIAEISYSLGYSHQAHFSRAFLRRTGLAPSEYRRAAR